MLIPVLKRELLAAQRRPSEAMSALLFFILVGSLFPLAVGPDAALLRAIAPGVIWVAALLAVLISLNRLFEPDLADGSLEQWLLAPAGLTGLVAAKTAAHWCIACVPLILVAPLMALQYGLDAGAVGTLVAALVLGTAVLTLVGALGAALTLGLRSHVLLALIMVPMSVPPLVFGCAAVAASQQGLSAAPQLSLLGACLSLAVFLGPWATAAALRLAME
ncbi:heme exporter protein CcmB [Acidovorax sp. MR-S7]|uniref:heme exporter protein CcmB n=1 Tax=Acidovorax sp. MR-S7 TaxID=1268622 RepID=UPI000361A80B|nr:heme exporter protein CcmB [Acidovorax sp. MR-S7]GAD23714.1 ABC-type transport system involved in cytochrome c biogenesis, permease component [Acidovorax sp. MR-S7]